MENTVTQEKINRILNKADYHVQTLHGKVTVVTATLPNGFTIVESSGCVDPANYSQGIGKDSCMKRIEDRVWAYEGYMLQSMRSIADSLPGRAVKQMDELLPQADFGWAINMLKLGYKVARKGWNGKGMFVYLVPGGDYTTQTEVAKKYFGDTASYNPYLAIKTPNGAVSTWVPSINDTLAEDWILVK